jgi:hypothetical protein
LLHTCPCGVSMLHVLAGSPCCMSTIHVHPKYSCCTYVNAACPYCMSMSMLHVLAA